MTAGCHSSRRRFLTGSASGALASTAAVPLLANSTASSFGRAKSVVVLYLYGAPSQMDTLDPKPDAPVERRSIFSNISGEFLNNIMNS